MGSSSNKKKDEKLHKKEKNAKKYQDRAERKRQKSEKKKLKQLRDSEGEQHQSNSTTQIKQEESPVMEVEQKSLKKRRLEPVTDGWKKESSSPKDRSIYGVANATGSNMNGPASSQTTSSLEKVLAASQASKLRDHSFFEENENLPEDYEEVEVDNADSDFEEEDNPAHVRLQNKPSSVKKSVTFASNARHEGVNPKTAFQVKVKVCKSDPHKEPLVVNFANGAPPQREIMLPSFDVYYLNPANQAGKYLHGTDEKCTYLASTLGAKFDGRSTKLLVGIYDKQENTLKLQNAAEMGTVFALTQHLTSKLTKQPTATSTRAYMSHTAARDALYSDFGSVKKKKLIKSQLANQIDITSVVANQAAVDAIKIREVNKSEIEEQLQENESDPVRKAFEEARKKLLPEFDKNAIHPYDVYDAKKIAGEAAWGQISRTIDACLYKDDWLTALIGDKSTTTPGARSKWPKSLEVVARSIQDSSFDEDIKYRLKSLLLLRHMMRFNQFFVRPFHPGTSDFLANFMGVPKEVASRFFCLFAEHTTKNGKSGYTGDKLQRDSRHIHLLLLYLIAHGRDMTVSSIEEFVNEVGTLNLNLATRLFNEAGCTTTKKGSDFSVSLSVPLTFPEPRLNRGKKKR